MKKLYTSPYAGEDETVYSVTLYELTRDEWYDFSDFSQQGFEDYFGLHSDEGCIEPGAEYHTYSFHLIGIYHLVIIHRASLNV